ncbi:MAG: VCBS repeat-containing protein [Verrucomicrobiales bacterium]|nr:VCBS repeat-containing protein [Verrucomicrobiales bacterium]
MEKAPAHEPTRTSRLGLSGFLAVALLVVGSHHAHAADVAWTTGSGFRSRALAVTSAGREPTPGFTWITSATTGVVFTNHLDEAAGAANRVLENGSGVAVGDYDGDDRPDIFLCSLEGRSALYRNLGDWRFTNVTETVGLSVAGHIARGAVFADINGDHRLDLLVTTLSQGVLCFVNEDAGRFRDATAQANLNGRPGTTTLALADTDGDGTLDLYITRYRAEDVRDDSNVEARRIGGRTQLHPKYEGRLFIGPRGLTEYGEPDSLMLNDGTGRFRPVPWNTGAFLDESGKTLAGEPRDWGLSASFRDINGDGFPDLYVCNDYWTADRLWLGDGRGQFRAASREAIRHVSENSMGIDFADIDRDGHVDFLVLDMLAREPARRRRQALAQTPRTPVAGEALDRPQYMRNMLYRNRGDGTWAEIAEFAGLAATGWSWQPLFLDVDLDGFEDVIISAGHRKDVQDLDATERILARQHRWPAGMDPSARQRAFTAELLDHSRLYPDLLSPLLGFRNEGNLRFREHTADWGFHLPGVHQGIATGDFDGDGDLDLVVNALNDLAGLYRNNATPRRIAVRLRGVPGNTQGIGACVTLSGDSVPRQSQEIVSGGRYLSGSEPQLTFAVPSTNTPLRLEVRWRSGRLRQITGVTPDRLYEIHELAGESDPPVAGIPSPPSRTLFHDVTARLIDAPDPHATSGPVRLEAHSRNVDALGPAAVWSDLNADQWQDLAVGTGPAGLILWTNDTRGGFGRDSSWMASGSNPVPPAAFVIAPSARSTPTVIASSQPLDSMVAREPRAAARILSSHGSADPPPLIDPQGHPGATGTLALADVDADGDLDLFAGGRWVPGKYPSPAASSLFVNDGGRWQPDLENRSVLQSLGRVHAATWGDLNEDGFPELVAATEWGPIRVFRNEKGRLHEVTEDLGLGRFRGWWRSVALVDIDADGRLDIVAGNWGLNTAYTRDPGPDTAIVWYYGDFLRRGVMDELETEWDPVLGQRASRLSMERLLPQFPVLRTHFPTHLAFATASATSVLSQLRTPFDTVSADTLATMAFVFRGDRVEPFPLPHDVQFSPAFGIAAADFDGDGFEDLFLAQDFFDVPWQEPRSDAGMGLLLLGRGSRGFVAVNSASSGIRLLGEQRAAAVADFDQDGRPDLAVTQNGAPTRLFHNQRAKPGLRLRLVGPPSNPHAFGANVRPRWSHGWGPVRSVVAGSGYLSQDGPVSVLGGDEIPSALRVRWAGGGISEVVVPPGTVEMTVRASDSNSSPAHQ